MKKPFKDCRLLVTPTSYGRNDPELKTYLEERFAGVEYNQTGRPLTAAELSARLEGVDGLIAGLDEITRDVIAGAEDLRVIARYGVGVDNVDLEAAREHGVAVTNTPGANAGSVADLTVALMLALLRSLVEAVQATRAGEWPRLGGTGLEGKTVGLIGFGEIGQAVARRLGGFGCRVAAFDVAPREEAAARLGVEMLALEEVLEQADLLSLHCSLVDATCGMVDADFLGRMKDGARLVNTARGELIDEEALRAALENGKLRGAALDVFSEQPPDPDHPLLQDSRVLVTPHMGAHTDLAKNEMGWGAVRNCLAVLQGEQPPNPVV